MLNYAIPLIVLSTSSINNPSIAQIIVDQGLVERVQIFSSPQVNGRVCCVIKIGGLVWYPRIPGYYYRLYGERIEIRDMTMLYPKENQLEFIGWSDEAGYDHEIQMILNVLPLSRQLRRVY